ncbi:MAG: glutamine-hydrolyzing carbamoyl-phosphate synthase small subunit [Thermosulfidibacteraceae bacterium]|jgi:carbamoyl-phosphate synthase small subunit
MQRKAILLLKDGTFFEGFSFGSEGEAIGEVVFNTSITGYQEILTDPSYKGQIIVMTYTEIGNYGTNEEDVESEKPQVEGFVVRNYQDYPSNWRCQKSLDEYLKEHRIVGITGIDTRALTKHIRNHGSQMGIISTIDFDLESLMKKLRSHPDISEMDLVSKVTVKEPIVYYHEEGRPLCVLYDFGVKKSILENLVRVGFSVIRVPANYPAEKALEMDPDCILLSNGPGDPRILDDVVENIAKLIDKKPIFGICLGHQIIGRILGCEIYKLKFGHHGGNHPVKDLKTGMIIITSQNHNYCVKIDKLKDTLELTYLNLYDKTEEGMKHKRYPIYSVQFHPEAGPGPNDALFIFERFMEICQKGTI